jgi:hypothetical protein
MQTQRRNSDSECHPLLRSVLDKAGDMKSSEIDDIFSINRKDSSKRPSIESLHQEYKYDTERYVLPYLASIVF